MGRLSTTKSITASHAKDDVVALQSVKLASKTSIPID